MPDTRPGPALLAEALAAIVAGSLAIRARSFESIAADIRRPPSDRRSASPEQSDRIRRAIRAWARRLPWTTKCFEQGLAAHWMLRRRGLPSTLFYGAATIDGVLKAHVWVKSGANDVVGCENSKDYALLARFPDYQVSLGSHDRGYGEGEE